MESGKVKNEELRSEELTLIRTANGCIKEAAGQPELQPLFGTLWQMGEITFLAGDTGKGKTILAVSIADAISKKQNNLLNQEVGHESKVLFYDFELNDRQFRKRYKDYKFNDNFYRIVINPAYLGTEQFSIETIRADVATTGADIIIIDNITALALKSTQNQDEALILMRGLKSLALQGLSILILAHTPKVAEGSKLGINHLAGSKLLSNFADSVFFIAQSKENPDYRYLKQVKCRNAEQLQEVIICELLNEQGRLYFDFVKYDHEDLHIESGNPVADIKVTEDMEKAYRLHKQGKSLRAIARELHVGKSTVDRWIKIYPSIAKDKTLKEAQKSNESDGTLGHFGTAGQWDSGTDNEQPEHSFEELEEEKDDFNSDNEEDEFEEDLIDEEENLEEEDNMENNNLKNEKLPGTGGTNGTMGQRDTLPATKIIINKYGQKVPIYFPDLLEMMGHKEEDQVPTPEEIESLKYVPVTVKPIYNPWEKEKVERANAYIKNWLNMCFKFSEKKKIKAIHLRAFFEEIDEYKNNYFGWKNLPENYEYKEFISIFHSKLEDMLSRIKEQDLDLFKFEIDENLEKEWNFILVELE